MVDKCLPNLRNRFQNILLEEANLDFICESGRKEFIVNKIRLFERCSLLNSIVVFLDRSSCYFKGVSKL